MSKQNKKSGKQKLKDFVQGQVNAVDAALGALGSAAKTASHAAGVITKPGLINKLSAAKKAASGVKNTLGYMGKAVYESGKSILNDRSTYTRFSNVTPAANVNRPMNPSQITSITSDPTMGGVVKVEDIYYQWTGFANSQAFDLVCFNYYEQIRKELKSNLPYTQNFLKTYLINAIALRMVCVTLKKLLEFRSYSTVDNPTLYKLFREVASGITGYGATTLNELEWLDDDNVNNSISIYDIIVDIADQMVLIPKRLNDFIDHYFGLVFSMDRDDFNRQIINPLLSSVEFASYSNDSDSITTNTVTIFSLSPNQVLQQLTDFSSKYGMISADIQKSQVGLSANKLPKYSDMHAEVYYDPTFIQAMINSYTDNQSVTDNNYIRLDLFTDNGKALDDDLTTYLFLGALQSQSEEFMNIPLIKCLSCCMKIFNNPNLNWELGFTQGGANAVYSNDTFGIVYSSSIYADVYINSITGQYISINNNIPISQSITNLSGNIAVSDVPCYVNVNGYVQSMAQPIVSGPVYAYFPIFRFASGNNAINAIGDATTEYTIFAEFKGQYSPLAIALQATGSYIAKSSTGDYFADSPAIPVWIFDTKQDTEIPCAVSNLKFDSAAITFIPKGALTSGQILSSSEILFPSLSNPISPATFSIDYNATKSQYVAMKTVLDTSMSFTNVLGTTTEVESSIGTDSGYLGLAEYIVEQMDHHIPIKSVHRINYKFSNDSDYSGVVQSTNLLKESYIPYFYQLDDLLPVAYQMMTSLLNPEIINNRLTTKHK